MRAASLLALALALPALAGCIGPEDASKELRGSSPPPKPPALQGASAQPAGSQREPPPPPPDEPPRQDEPRPADEAPTEEAPPPPPPAKEPPVRLKGTEFLTGMQPSTLLTHAGDGSGRLFLVEKQGRILVIRDGEVLETPFLDLRGEVSEGNEQGLLGLAFAPDFARSGRVYVSYTDTEGTSQLVRYRVHLLDDDRLDPRSAERILEVPQPHEFHNAGGIAFGPDGYLYYALGDGSKNPDTAQDTSNLYGSILRLDVAGDGPGYAIPPDNPFVDGGGRPEIWAFGLRNPWRFSIDPATGDLWIGDVGNEDREEVNHLPAGVADANFGWNVWEGTVRKLDREPVSEVTMPVVDYTQQDGRCAVIGGHMYRGAAIPALQGMYVYADYCKGTLWGLRLEEGAWQHYTLGKVPGVPMSFGIDAEGELYTMHQFGLVARIVAA